MTMDFRELKKFLNSLKKEYDIPGFDCCIYYDHNYVFRHKAGVSSDATRKKVSGKDLYFLHSAAKLVCCVALMQLAERYKIALDDCVSKYVDTFADGVTVREFIKNYSGNLRNEDDCFNHENVKKLIESASGADFNDFIREHITAPLKMKSTTFELNDENSGRIAMQYVYDKSKKETLIRSESAKAVYDRNAGSLITGVEDFVLFAETLCAGGTSKKGYRLLSEFSVDVLINQLIYKETEKDDAYVSVGYHRSLVLIDIKKKITIVFAEHLKDIGASQLEVYPKMRKLVYECIGVDTWSKGYNIFA